MWGLITVPTMRPRCIYTNSTNTNDNEHDYHDNDNDIIIIIMTIIIISSSSSVIVIIIITITITINITITITITITVSGVVIITIWIAPSKVQVRRIRRLRGVVIRPPGAGCAAAPRQVHIGLKQTLNSKGWEFSCPLNVIVSLPESLTQGLLIGKLLVGGLGIVVVGRAAASCQNAPRTRKYDSYYVIIQTANNNEQHYIGSLSHRVLYHTYWTEHVSLVMMPVVLPTVPRAVLCFVCVCVFLLQAWW